MGRDQRPPCSAPASNRHTPLRRLTLGVARPYGARTRGEALLAWKLFLTTSASCGSARWRGVSGRRDGWRPSVIGARDLREPRQATFARLTMRRRRGSAVWQFAPGDAADHDAHSWRAPWSLPLRGELAQYVTGTPGDLSRRGTSACRRSPRCWPPADALVLTDRQVPAEVVADDRDPHLRPAAAALKPVRLIRMSA
jgi:hypothetical protein